MTTQNPAPVSVEKAVRIAATDYTLAFNFNMLCETEMAAGRSIFGLFADLTMTSVGHAFRAALLKHHPDLTVGQLNELIDQAGPSNVVEWVRDGILAYLGDTATAKPSRRRKAT